MLSQVRRASGCFLVGVLLALAAQAAHALTVSVSLNPNRARPNEALIANLTVSNDGGSAVSGVSLQALMPATGVNNFFATLLTGGGTCRGSAAGACVANELVTWNLGIIPAGSGITVQMPMTVSNGTASGSTVALEATAFISGAQAAKVTKSVGVSSTNALSLAVNGNKDGVVPGDQLTYSLVYGNRSTSSVTGTMLSLPLPPGVTFVSASGGGVLMGTNVQWSLNTLQAGQSGRQQVVVSVVNGLSAGAVLPVDAASLSGTSAVTGLESALATLVTRVQPSQSLVLALAMNADPARSNEGLRAALTVTNTSGATLSDAVLQARVPTEGANNFFATLLTGGGTCRDNIAGACVAYELATWNVGTLAPGASVTYSMAMTVSNGTASGALVALNAFLSADGVPVLTARHTVAVDNDNALTLAVDADKDAVAPSGQLVYTLTFGNRGTTSVTGSALELPLPPGVSFVSASGGGTLSGNTVHWTLNTLQAGQSSREQVVVSVGGTLAAGTVLSVDPATLSGTSATTGVESARGTLVTRVKSDPVLGLALAMNADPVRSNEALRAALTVTNLSNAPVFGTVLQARVPTDNVNNFFATLLTGGGTCRDSTSGACVAYELVTWNIGTLAPGASVTVSMAMATANGTPSGELVVLEANLNGDGVSLVTARHTAAVDNDNALSLAIDTNKDPVAPSDKLTYTLTFGNRSTGTITGTTLTFPLPPGTTLVGSSGGSLNGGLVSWNIGSLQAGVGGRHRDDCGPACTRRWLESAGRCGGAGGQQRSHGSGISASKRGDASPCESARACVEPCAEPHCPE